MKKALLAIIMILFLLTAGQAEGGADAAVLTAAYAGIEDGVEFLLTPADTVPPVVSGADKESALRFLTGIGDGVYTWSADMEGLVESSSNLGLFFLDQEGVSAVSDIRSSVSALLTEQTEAQLALGGECGYRAECTKVSDAWPYDPDSRLLARVKEVYRAQNGEDIIVAVLHAGLECGTFKELMPEMDMASIGPDLTDVHTINETLYLDSIPRVWRLLEALLATAGG